MTNQKRQLPPERAEEFDRLWATLSPGDVAEAFGFSKKNLSVVNRWAEERGLPKPKRRASHSTKQAEILRRMWAENAPREEIADALGVRKERVRQIATDLGLPARAMDYRDGKMPWSAEEDARLTLYYVEKRTPASHLVGLFPGRSEQAIAGRISLLGLGKMRKGKLRRRGDMPVEILADKIVSALQEHGQMTVGALRLRTDAPTPQALHIALRRAIGEGKVKRAGHGAYEAAAR